MARETDDADHHIVTTEAQQRKSLAYGLHEMRYQIEKESIWLTAEQKIKFVPELGSARANGEVAGPHD